MNNVGSTTNSTLHPQMPTSNSTENISQRREKVLQVKEAVKNLIINARSDQKFINSLGPLWGDYSRQNIQLKSIMNSPPVPDNLKHSYTHLAKKMKKEAKEVIKLVKTGFEGLEKPVPQEINRNISLLESALQEMYKAV